MSQRNLELVAVGGSQAAIDLAATVANFKLNMKCKFPVATVLDVSGSMTALGGASGPTAVEVANLAACFGAKLPSGTGGFIAQKVWTEGVNQAQRTGRCPAGAADLWKALKAKATKTDADFDAFLNAALPSYAVFRKRIDGMQQLASLMVQVMQVSGDGTFITFSTGTNLVMEPAEYDGKTPAQVDALIKSKVCPPVQWFTVDGVIFKAPICGGVTNYAAALTNLTSWAAKTSGKSDFTFGSVVYITDGSPNGGSADENSDAKLGPRFTKLKTPKSSGGYGMHVLTVSVVTPDATQQARLESFASVATDISTGVSAPSFIAAASWDWAAVIDKIMKATTKLCYPIYTFYFDNGLSDKCDAGCALRGEDGTCPTPATNKCTMPAPPAFKKDNNKPYFNTGSPKGCAVNADSQCANRVDIIKQNLAKVPVCGAGKKKYILCFASSQARGAFMMTQLAPGPDSSDWKVVAGGDNSAGSSDVATDIFQRFCAVSCGCVPKAYKANAGGAPECNL